MTDRPGSYHHKPAATLDMKALAEMVDKAIIKAFATKPEADSGERVNKNEETAALSRSVKRWRVGVYGLGTITTALIVIVSNLWAYLQGYAEERAQEVIAAKEAAETARDLAERVQSNSATLSELRASTAAIENVERNLSDLSRLNALQWAYLTQVIDAVQKRQKIPAPSQSLVDAVERRGSESRNAKKWP